MSLERVVPLSTAKKHHNHSQLGLTPCVTTNVAEVSQCLPRPLHNHYSNNSPLPDSHLSNRREFLTKLLFPLSISFAGITWHLKARREKASSKLITDRFSSTLKENQSHFLTECKGTKSIPPPAYQTVVQVAYKVSEILLFLLQL